MKTEEQLYKLITERCLEAQKEISERFSNLAEKNKQVNENPFGDSINFTDTQKALWKSINFLDRLFIESMKEKSVLVKSLMILLSAWHEYHDQPAIKDASERFFEEYITYVIKSSRAEELIMKATDDLRQLVLLDILEDKKNDRKLK